MAATNQKVKFGFSNVHYALLKEGNTFGTPKPIKGGVKVSLTAEGSQSTFHADNCAYAVFSTNGGYTGEIEFAYMTPEMAKDLLGEKAAANGVNYEISNAKPVQFALLYEVSGNTEDNRYAMYNCTASRADKSAETTGDDITPGTVTLKFTAIPYDVKGEPVVYGWVENTETSKKAYEQWMTKVTLPGEAIV